MKLINIIGIILLGVFVASCNFPLSKAAAKQFNNRPGPFTVTVFPVRIVSGGAAEYDKDFCHELVAWLQAENIAWGETSAVAIEFPVQWHRNQARMLKESASAYADQVKGMDIQSEYALLAEILCNRDKTHVGGVHFYLADNQGELVSVGLNNSHWEEYKTIQPKSSHDGIEVVKLMLKNSWIE